MSVEARMTFEDLLRRFPIEGDWEEDYARQGWQDDAAEEFFSKLRENQEDVNLTESDGT